MVCHSRDKNKSKSCMSQILGSRCALQDLAGELLVGHSLRLWGECSERKSFSAQSQPHMPTLHQEVLREGNIILQLLPSTEKTPFFL